MDIDPGPWMDQASIEKEVGNELVAGDLAWEAV